MPTSRLYGICVNAIGPGYFETELTSALVADEGVPPGSRGRTPAGRWGRGGGPGRAPLIWLASDASSFVNGQVVYVDGGMLSVLSVRPGPPPPSPPIANKLQQARPRRTFLEVGPRSVGPEPPGGTPVSTLTPTRPSRLARVGAALTRRSGPASAAWARSSLLHVVGWGLLLFVIVPAHYQVGATGVFGVGLGVTAYTLGMRHAFDADHIAAIDNTTRKLMADGQAPAVGRASGSRSGTPASCSGCACCSASAYASLAGQVETTTRRRCTTSPA